MKMQMKMLSYGIVFLVLICSIGLVLAVPNTPNSVSKGLDSSFYQNNTTKTQDAYGGNISQLGIDDTRQTSRWQGYYGNITSRITLDNADNYTMIDWSLGTVEGEVYAANDTVSDWSTIHCVNLSPTYGNVNCSWSSSTRSQDSNDTLSCLNVSKLEDAYGMAYTDQDGVNETFDGTLTSITVGTVTLDSCYVAELYDETEAVAGYWNETILTINNSETVIYAAIVSDDGLGFNNASWDFQMIVGDNGDDSSPTTYNFYVELT